MTTLSTNYTDRTVDLLITGSTTLNKEVPVSLAIDTPKLTTGLQKTIQRFIVLILSAEDTTSLFTDYGSSFMTAVLNGSIINEIEANAFFSASVISTLNYLNKYVTADTPLDEQILSADLLNVSFSGGKLILDVRITTKAGSAITVYLPIEAAIQ